MGRNRGRGERQTFAELAEGVRAESPESHGQPVAYPSFIADGEYTDDQGVHWRMRRGDLRWSRIEQLVRDPDVRILHLYLNDITDVPTGDRQDLLGRIRPYLKSQRELDDHTDFAVAEFKDDRHRSSIVIEESC